MSLTSSHAETESCTSAVAFVSLAAVDVPWPPASVSNIDCMQRRPVRVSYTLTNLRRYQAQDDGSVGAVQ